MAKIGNTATSDFKERLIPEMDLQVEVLKATGKVYKSGRKGVELYLEVIDYIGMDEDDELDMEEVVDPVEEKKKVTARIFFPKDGDTKSTEEMFMGRYVDYVKNFGVDNLPEDLDTDDDGAEKVVAQCFEERVGGVRMKHELNKMSGKMQSVVDRSVEVI